MRGAVPLYNQLEVCVGIDNKEKLRLYDIIEPMPNRWSFAVNDPEQIYDWQKVGLRRTSGVLLNFPNSLIAQKIAWPDKTIFPADGNIMSGSIFYSQLFKNATHTLSKHVFGNVVRSMSTGYSRVDRYRRVSCIGDEMLSLALTLRDQDAELTKHAEAIRKQSDTPLGKLSKNLNDANRIYTDFVQGRLAMSPSNLRSLETACKGIAELCDQKAGLHSDNGASTHWFDPKKQPSANMRAIMDSKQISNSKDAFAFLAYVSCLVADGGLALSTQEFYPQDQLYLGPKGAYAASVVISDILDHHQLRINRTANGMMIMPDLPPSAMLKPVHSESSGRLKGYKQASPAEIIAVANEVKAYMNKKFADRINRLLDYADEHYQDLEASMSQDDVKTIRQEKQRALLNDPRKKIEFVNSYLQTSRLDLPTNEVNAAQAQVSQFYQPSYGLKDYLFRPETKWEMGKLYGRFLPQYFFTELVQIANRSILGGTAIPSRANLLSAGFNMLTAPVSNSVSNTVSLEFFRKSKHDAVGKARTVQTLHKGVFTELLADPDYEAIKAKITDDTELEKIAKTIARLDQVPADKRDGTHYQKLAEQFRSLAFLAHEKQEAVLSEFFGITDQQSLPNHLLEIAEHGAKSKGDALLMIGFVNMLMEHSVSDILSMEYVAPNKLIWDDKELNTFSDHILESAQQAGLIVQDGHLLIATDKGLKKADTNTLLRFANLSAQTLMETADLGALLHSTYGTYSHEYMKSLEQMIVPEFYEGKDETSSHTLGAFKHKENAWHSTDDQMPSMYSTTMSHLTRPEFKHELNKEFERNFIAQIFHFPTVLVENYLLGVSGMSQGKKAFITPKNLRSATLQAATLPLAVSYGALSAREMTRINKQIASEYADRAQSSIGGFIDHMQASIPHIQKDTSLQSGLLVTDRPEALQRPEDYFDNYIQSMQRLKDGVTQKDRQDVTVKGLSGDINQASEALGFLIRSQQLLNTISKNVNVLRFVAPEEASASPAEIREVASFINGQVIQAMKEPDVSKASVRLARVVGEKIRSTFSDEYLMQQIEKLNAPHTTHLAESQVNPDQNVINVS